MLVGDLSTKSVVSTKRNPKACLATWPEEKFDTRTTVIRSKIILFIANSLILFLSPEWRRPKIKNLLFLQNLNQQKAKLTQQGILKTLNGLQLTILLNLSN